MDEFDDTLDGNDDWPDLEFDDITGATEEKKKKTERKTKKKLTEWEETIERLEAHCKKAWICIPEMEGETLKLNIKEVGEATGEEFYDWVNIIWPPGKDSSHKPSSYKTKRERTKSHTAMLSFLPALSDKFRSITMKH